jgi:hypothetical protein
MMVVQRVADIILRRHIYKVDFNAELIFDGRKRVAQNRAFVTGGVVVGEVVAPASIALPDHLKKAIDERNHWWEKKQDDWNKERLDIFKKQGVWMIDRTKGESLKGLPIFLPPGQASSTVKLFGKEAENSNLVKGFWRKLKNAFRPTSLMGGSSSFTQEGLA